MSSPALPGVPFGAPQAPASPMAGAPQLTMALAPAPASGYGSQTPAYQPPYIPQGSVSNNNPININQSNVYGGGDQTVHISFPTNFGVPFAPALAPSTMPLP
ncbi:MAG: hypothetical protein KC476_02500, partial [Cyanobacteria bacterium HKST-UBA06]|nr:hypothetical protein [Cyanobacteria bacterium HKST-UBA06]